ncbi:universal stress protein [Massilia glaciei]|uniref:Universal stress protein n=1 Tax=Massilia glaciei TaxID=1524097 RepID=A0A2U2I5E1_9BURK|nr:universal stress protein [Massilia glaciei]PWF54971.1 universal stress protein [Massilia glaciei]
MQYKTLLLQADQSCNWAERTRIALALARQYEAHLIGAAVTGGVAQFAFPGAWAGDDGSGTGAYSPFLIAQRDLLRERAEHAVAAFEAAVAAQGLRSHEGVVIDQEAGLGMSLRARYSDLAIIGQSKAGEPNQAVPNDLPQYLLMSCGRPVLIIPHNGTFTSVGRRPMLAWDGSLSATRAVHGALPILRRAEQVDVVVFTGDQTDVGGEQAGDDIALLLARHDVKVNVLRPASSIDDGHSLLSLAPDCGADVIVMGCYGHTSLREMVMGGVTRTVLRNMTIPVLMAH